MLVVYGKDNCNFYNLPKSFLEQCNEQYKYIHISDNLTDFLDDIADLTGNHRTIPLIFKNSKFIGGYSQLLEIIDFELNDEF